MVAMMFVIACVFQESPYRYQAPDDLNGHYRSEFEAKMLKGKYSTFESNWKSSCNPNRIVANEEMSKLWENNVSIDLKWVKNSRLNISRVGLSVEKELIEVHRRTFATFNENLQKLRKTEHAKDLTVELSDVLDRLKSRLPRDARSLSMFAEIKSEVVAGKNEQWLLVEVRRSPSAFTIFPRFLHHTLSLQQNNDMEMVQPHPETELTNLLSREYDQQPLKANRPVVKTFELDDIEDDGLSNSDRELKYNYTLSTGQRGDEFQIEAISWDIDIPPLFTKSRSAEVLLNRIPRGTVANYDYIHRVAGEFCTELDSSTGGNVQFLFAIVPYKHGKYTYSKLMVQATPK